MKVLEYLKSIKREIRYINWPTKAQTVTFTVLVVIISIVIAYFLGLFDFIFKLGIEQIL